MHNLWKKLENPLDQAIAQVHESFKSADPTTGEYTTAVKNLQTLETIKADIKAKRVPSADSILAAGVSLGSVVIILLAEAYGHAVPKLVSSFLMRLKH